MCALSIELLQPIVKIALKLFNAAVDALSKSYLIELVEYCSVEPFNNTVGLWRSSFSACVLNVIER